MKSQRTTQIAFAPSGDVATTTEESCMNRRIWATLVIALALVASFAIGDSVGQRTMLSVASRQLNGVQAMLAFNHLLDGRQLKSLLAEDCIAQAASAIDIAVDKDTETLAELLLKSLPVVYEFSDLPLRVRAFSS
jgi:hypothetical protein